jgi:hypothetical protein
MSPQEIEKLLGGYATDTLSDEERRTLLEAALGNQALFDALADEQALRELLQDPGTRAHLLGVLREAKPSPLARMGAWLRRPSALALAGAVAAGVVVIGVVGTGRKAPAPAQVSMLTTPKPAEPEVRTQQETPAELKSETKPAAASERRAKAAKREETESDSARTRPAEASQVAQPKAADSVEPAARPAAPPAAATVQAPAAISALPPPPPPPAAAAAAEGRKELSKDGPAQNARDLYYAAQPARMNAFMDDENAAKKAKRQEGARPFGNTMGRVAAPAGGRQIPGVRYSILKRQADGSFADADPEGAFAAGDALRVRFETNQPGSLEVLERQPNGSWSLRMGARMQPGVAVYMPSESTIDLRNVGETRFFVKFSRAAAPVAVRADQVRPTPGLVQNKVSNAIYSVNRSPAVDAAVEFEFTIVAK